MRNTHIIELLRSAALIPPSRALRPRVGDWVVDLSRGTPSITYYGRLEQVYIKDNEKVYVVWVPATETLETWDHTMVATVKGHER